MSSNKSNFHPLCRDPEFFLGDEESWEVKMGESFSIVNMSDAELMEAIVQDVLCVTAWEQEMNRKLDFGIEQLLRFVPSQIWREKVVLLLKQGEIKGLFDQNGTQVRIKSDRAVMQTAMDYCGLWMYGYDIPDSALKFNAEGFTEAVEKHGGLNNLVAAMGMDLHASSSGNNTKH